MRSALLLSLVAALTAACFVIAASGATAVTSCSTGPFTSPGEYCYAPPAGTTAVRVVAIGGGGGIGGGTTFNGIHHAGATGGSGARVTGYLTNLSPSTSLWVEVGGKGANGGDLPANPTPLANTPGGSGGFNGGGAGGASKAVPPDPGFGGSPGFPPTGGGAGGGGGASDVRTTACTPSCPGDTTAQGTRRLVAGGGGGGGGYSGTAGAGGAGSGTGENGGDGSRGAWFVSGGRGGQAADANGGTGGGNFGGGSGGGAGGYRGGTGGATGPSNNTGPGAGGGGGSSFASFALGAAISTSSSATDGSVAITPVSQTSLATTASSPVAVGGQISDTATLSGGSSPTGTITFKAYGPDDTSCANSPAFTATASVTANGSYSSGAFTPSAAGTYRFVASYGGDDNNSPATGSCGDAGESVVVSKTQPTLTTQASAPVTIGGTIQDDATLSGGNNPTGTLTFKAYGPDDADCSGPTVLSAPKTVSGNGTYNSGAFPPNDAGTYRFVVSYSGDARNAPVTGACLDPSESVVVSKAQPSLSTTASAPVAVGGQISDQATLSGGQGPTGTLTFAVYAPDDSTCAGPPVFSSSATVNGNASYGSGSFTPTAPGTYRFVASYGGDGNNESATGSCGDSDESVVVSQAQPSLATSASQGTSAGGEISDGATLSGGYNPTGTLTFTAYGPDDATCQSTPVYTSTVQVTGNGTYSSGPFTAAGAGTYRFVASYGGDANNAGQTGSCGDAGESVGVSKAQPSVSTSASSDIVAGGQISDQATVSGGAAPTGTITFTAYGPDDATCQDTPAYTSTVQVNGNGSYGSGPFTPNDAGTYRFVASYGGDANNSSAAGSCNDAGESVSVSPAHPTLTTTASAPVGVGGDISDRASLSGGFNPTGTITFEAYGPDDATCGGPAAFTSTATVDAGNGSYDSDEFTATQAGAYRFVATYSGDANNDPVSSACMDPSESVVVTKAQPALSTTASDSTAVGGEISDSATLSSGYDPTGTITFDVYGPDDASCASAPAFTSTVDVDGNGDYDSGAFTPAAVGTYRFVASYSGDENNESAMGACGDDGESVAVTKHATETSISCPDGTVGDSESCTLQVKDVDAGSKTNPSGTVDLSAPGGGGSFASSSCTLQPVSGSSDASRCVPAPAYTPTAAGTNDVQADFSGDATHFASSSGQVGTTVAKHSTTTSISCPTGTTGDTESCAISVKDGNGGSKTNPSGTVGLSAPDGHGSFAASSCSLQPVSGSSDTSRCDPEPSYTPTDAGTDEVRADYQGDSTHASSGSGATDVEVARHATETSISCADGVVGDVQSCTVSVEDVNGGSKTNPEGTVDLSAPGGDGAFDSSSCDLQPVSGSPDKSSCDPAPAYTANSAGTNNVKADYAGDATHASSSSGEQDVSAAKHSSETSVSCTPDSLVAGSATTCTATVSDGRSGSPPRPAGTVTFTTDGNGSFSHSGSCTLTASDGNSCRVTYTAAAAGSHGITAAYGGDANHTASSGRAAVAASALAETGGGPTPAAEAPQPDGLSLSHRNPLIRHGRALITLRCRGPRGSSCKGVLVLTASRLTNRLRAAAMHKTSVRFTVAAGHEKVLRVRVPKSSLARLRHLRKTVAIASVALEMADGETKAQDRAITIVRR